MKSIKYLLSKIQLSKRNRSVGLKESGQSIIIITLAFLGLLAMLGLALDVGLVYIARVRLKRTVDAAALAAVGELPVEEESAVRAMSYLHENGYDITSTNVYVAGCIQDIHDEYLVSGATGSDGADDLINLPTQTTIDNDGLLLNPNDNLPLTPDPDIYYHYLQYDPDGDGNAILESSGEYKIDPDDGAAFYVDTRSYQDRSDPGVSELCDTGQRVSGSAASFGGASRIKVAGQVPVRMNFMQFFGFSEVVVADSAVAENSSTLDVSVVLDTTGSMEYDTICYGCWARCGNGDSNSGLIDPSECDAADQYHQYPENGRAFPYSYDGAIMQNLITGNDGLPRPEDRNADGDWNDTDEDFIVIEAEFYTNNFSSWDPAFRSAGKGYWAIQRNQEGKAYSIDGYGYSGNDFDEIHRSGAVRHHPYIGLNSGNQFGKTYSLSDAQNNVAPTLEYDFMPKWSGRTYIYIRALYYSGRRFFWSVANAADTTVVSVDQENSTSSSGGGGRRGQGYAGSTYDGESDEYWRWTRVDTGGTNLNSDELYTLKISAGSPGWEMDRIIITNRELSEDDFNNASLGSSHSVRQLREASATTGSAQGLAADRCNPIFGLSVLPSDCTHMTIFQPTNNLNDSLFSAMDPMRGAQESIRSFIARLDPELDQAGFVDFSSDGWQRSQLECLRASRARESDAGAGNQAANWPLNAGVYEEYDELTCFDASGAVAGTKPVSYTAVFVGIEQAYPPGGDTDIADGLRRGLHLMGINTGDDGSDDGSHANDCAWDYSGSNWQLPRLSGNWKTQDGSTDTKSNPVISHCARGQAATGIIVLLTDGAPTNSNPGDDSACNTVPSPVPYEGFDSGDDKFNCIMYYADVAADNGILVYTIGLGVGADRNLLNAVSDMTNAKAYFVLTASQLNVIFDQILANVYIRLVQ